MQERTRAVQRAALLSLVGNSVLAVTKILVGFFSHSLAVLGDGIDSSTDVLISVVALFASSLMAKPGDKKHPYGHSRAETSATAILAFVIFFAGAQLLLGTISKLSNSRTDVLPGAMALWITCFSIIVKLGLAYNQFRVGKRTGSTMLIANGKNMRNDVIMSVSVLAGLITTRILGTALVDYITAIAVSLWVMHSAIGVWKDANDEIMDSCDDPDLYDELFKAVRSVPGATNPHRTRIRRLASCYDIDLDIEVDGKLSVKDAHDIAHRVEEEIKKRIDNVYDIVVHVEPHGEGEHDEQFGLKEERD